MRIHRRTPGFSSACWHLLPPRGPGSCVERHAVVRMECAPLLLAPDMVNYPTSLLFCFSPTRQPLIASCLAGARASRPAGIPLQISPLNVPLLL